MPIMTDARYQQVKDLFYQVSEMEPERQEAFLAEACAGDQHLQSQVQRLLHSTGDDDKFLAQPVVPADALREIALASLAEHADHDAMPQRIGRYRIIRLLGEGGMGCVYEAEQDVPQRRVALKVLRSGHVSQRMLQRFQREVEMLGRLRHPGIAQIYDAGVAEVVHHRLTHESNGHAGPMQPYFAMELIDGVSISEWAAAHNVDLHDRLSLLARVCDAVHFGHQQGVVHRDLKPANILVEQEKEETERRNDGETEPDQVEANRISSVRLSATSSLATPKIIDFGVARATDSDLARATLQTDAGQILGTLAYMSPEQVRGDTAAADARADVYALGVIGYELLTGRLPYDTAGKVVGEAARIIRDEEPSRMSSISSVFRGDIETIFAKALEKDPARRYASAEALAADIRRYLNDEPIVARPATLGYQLTKFARRHKEFVAGLVLVFIVLVAGIVGTTLALVRARAALTLAKTRQTQSERQSVRAQQIKDLVTGILTSAKPGAPGGGPDVRVVEVLEPAVRSIGETLADQPDVERELRELFADTYNALGMYPAAAENYRRAFQLAQRTLSDDSRDRLRLVRRLASTLLNDDQNAEAETLLREPMAVAALSMQPQDLLRIELEVQMLRAIANQHRHDEALAFAATLIERLRAVPPSTERDGILGHVLYLNAWTLERVHNTEVASRVLDEAFTVCAKWRDVSEFDRSGGMRRLKAFLLLCHGRPHESLETLMPVLDEARAVLADMHPQTISVLRDTINLLEFAGRFDEALPLNEAYCSYAKTVRGERSEQWADAFSDHAVILARLNRREEAKAEFQNVIARRREAFGESDKWVVRTWRAAQIHLGLEPLMHNLDPAWRAITEDLLRLDYQPSSNALSMDEFDWPETDVMLLRWEGDTSEQAGAFTVAARMRLADVCSARPPQPGNYLRIIVIPNRSGAPIVLARWITVGPWNLTTYDIFGLDGLSWTQELSPAPSRELTLPTLDWCIDPRGLGIGPGDGQAFFQARAQAHIALPAGDYRLRVRVDDCARVWRNDEMIMTDWGWAPYHESTLDFHSDGQGDRFQVQYLQGRGGATMEWQIIPRDPRSTQIPAELFAEDVAATIQRLLAANLQ